jgi:tetratricopeptide (TPR) repeat protein
VRTVLDLHAANFLKWVAAGPLRSRVLFTSRLFPRDLDGVAGCRREPLKGLDEEEAVRFFAAHQIRGTRAEIHAIAAPYGYHPLALRLLAGMILNDVQNPGDTKVALEYDALPELVPRRHHVLAWALNATTEQARELLSRLSALRSSADFGMALVVTPETSEAELKRALRELIDRNLLVQDSEGRFDMHSVVRRFAYQRLGDRTKTHARLATYFEGLPKPPLPASLEDAGAWMELVQHRARSGDVRGAYTAFNRYLGERLFRLGAFNVSVGLLELISAGERERGDLRAEERAGLLHGLGILYGTLGMTQLCAENLRAAVGVKGGGALSLTWYNLGVAHIALGELRKAEEVLLRLSSGSVSSESSRHSVLALADLYTCMGEYSKAAFQLSRVARLQTLDANQRMKTLLSSAFRLIAMRKFAEARTTVERANALRTKSGVAEATLVSLDFIFGGTLVELQRESATRDDEMLKQAEAHLSEALTRCRRIQFVTREPEILNHWAKWASIQGKMPEARGYAAEALAIANRIERRLAEADVGVTLAQLEFAMGDRTIARSRAEFARERAFCDGPPYYNKKAYDEAEELLRMIDDGAVAP